MLSLPFHRLTGLAGLAGITAGPNADAAPTTSTSTTSTSTTTTRSLQLDERVQDWLDDKIQSDADLAGLDDLIAAMTAQRAQLEAQQTAAEDALAQARTEAAAAQTALAGRIAEFDALQRSLDSRMSALAADAPDEALAQLQAPVRRLRGVRLARNYVAFLRDVHEWRAAVGTALGSTPPDVSAALDHCAHLRRLAARLHQLQPAADDAAVHLVEFVDAVAVAVAGDVTAALTARLDGVLAARRWPVGVDPDGTEVVDAEWRMCFQQLLDAQIPELLDRCALGRSDGGGGGAGLGTLLPMDAMAAVFAAEFRYHFLAANATSQPDGLLSHCYPWVLHTLDRWERFLRDNFGPVMAARLADTAAAAFPAYVDPACALITSLLPLLREKLAAVLPHAQAHPAFLAEFVPRLVAFEDQLRTRCGFLAYPPPLPTSSSNPSLSPSFTGADDADEDGDDDAEAAWPNLAAPVVDQCFATWSTAQKAHALQRYRDIVAAPAGRELDADVIHASSSGSGSNRARPTVAAVQVTELLRAVTAVWTGLRRVGQRAALLDVQLTILDAFHDRLGDALDAVQAASSAVVRTLHGVAALPGAGVLAALCRVVGSADHVAAALGLWTNEPVFVALGRQMLLQQRRDDGSGPDPALAADTDSAAHGVFHESIRAYTRRRDAALDLLVNALADSHAKAFRAYLARPHWTTVAAADDTSDTDTLVRACFFVSPELDEPLQVLQRNLAVVAPALGAAALRRTWRRALERLHELLWSEVLMRHRFSRAGAAQFRADLDALLALLDRALPAGAGRAALTGLAEALVLLTLPADAPVDAPTDAPAAAWTLRRVADRLFTDGAEARRVLEALGLATVSPANARNIVQRRIESSE